MLRPSLNTAMLALAALAARQIARARKTRFIEIGFNCLVGTIMPGKGLPASTLPPSQPPSLQASKSLPPTPGRLGGQEAGRLADSRPRVELLIYPLQTSPRNVCVDLRRRDVGVAEHHLHGAQVGAVFEEVRGERMAQHVRRNVRLDPRHARVAHDLHPERLPRHRTSAARQKEMRIGVLIECGTSALAIAQDRV